MALERPETIAGYALNIETENLSKDYYKNYLERINAVTIADVQKAAQKYFSTENARIVVAGKGSEVLENLEKVSFNGKTIPVMYYDKMVNKVEKPNYTAAIPEGMNAKTVIENYIKAIGGKDKLAGVSSYSMSAEAEIQGMKLNLEIKKTTNDQFMQDVKMMGNSMSKQVVDGNSGYMVMQGQRKDLDETELAKIKVESAPFAELNYNFENLQLEGIEDVDGKKAYKIKISDEKASFYDVATGLKVQDVLTAEMNGQKMSSSLIFQITRKFQEFYFLSL